MASAALVAVVGVLAAYLGHVNVGLYYDDYHFVRPWSEIDLHRVWFGSWDPTGVESVFFRPLTAYLFAGRFWLFGLNAGAMHGLSLAGHVLCAVMVAAVVRREQASRDVALFAGWVYAIHPVLPYAQVSWLTNQMHLAESVVVLGALLTWQTVRDRRWVWWTPLPVLAVVVFLIKEDGVMLLPALAAATVCYAVLVRPDLRVRAAATLLMALAAAVLLFTWRYARLGRLGGYGSPDLAGAIANYWRGAKATLLLWPTRNPWAAVASGVALLPIAVAAVMLWRRHRRVAVAGAIAATALAWNLKMLALERAGGYPLMTWQGVASGVVTGMLVSGALLALAADHRRSLVLIGLGLTLLAAFDLPFVLVTKREQYHLLALGSVLALAGAAGAIDAWASSVELAWRRLVVPAFVVGSVPLVLLTRLAGADFSPCAPGVLGGDQAAMSWWVVPDEIKSWLATKAERCAQGDEIPALLETPLIAWGTYPADTTGADTGPYAWTSDHAVFLLDRAQREWTVAIRRPGAAASTPVRVLVSVDGRRLRDVLATDSWTAMTIPLTQSLVEGLRGSHRVDFTVSPFFVPARLDPRASDLRRFGVQWRTESLR